jgi:hypothetical protein
MNELTAGLKRFFGFQQNCRLISITLAYVWENEKFVQVVSSFRLSDKVESTVRGSFEGCIHDPVPFLNTSSL